MSNVNLQTKSSKMDKFKYEGFNSFLMQSGYYPFNMDKEEVLRMCEYLQGLELALKCYEEEKVQVDFENGNMFMVFLEEDEEIRNYGEVPFSLERIWK